MAQRSAFVVAITGASSGIGRATAILFGRRGWRVGLIARSEPDLDEVRRDVLATGATAIVAAADVGDSEALERAAATVERGLGPIDVWINDAGVGVVAPFTRTTEAEFRHTTETTYLGAVNGTRVALRRMVPRGQGTIVNVASAVSYRAAPLMSAYSGAKFALRGFTEAVRSELIHDRSAVHLTIVHPPSVNTPFFSHAPSRAMGEGVPRPPVPVVQPEVIADAIYFAATHRRREVMVGAQTVQFARLNQIAPGLADWLFGRIGYAMQRTSDKAAIRRRDPALFRPGERSPQLWVTRHRGLVALGLGVGALALFGGTMGRSLGK